MRTTRKIILSLAGLLLAPGPEATPTRPPARRNGWHDGFNHPLHGWDHLVVMIAVGLWAAQQRGRAVWLVPLTFVGVMTLGGLAGVTGVSLPGIEMGILVSVAVFSVLVARKVRLRTGTSMLIAGFFAFFHGFAHGAEMPGIGQHHWLRQDLSPRRCCCTAWAWSPRAWQRWRFACLMSTPAMAQPATNAPPAEPAPGTNGAVRLPEVVVNGRQDSMLGIAASASQGTVGAAQIEDRPILRSGEILETVPGVIITQHASAAERRTSSFCAALILITVLTSRFSSTTCR